LNGVEQVERDGQMFRLLRVPSFEYDRALTRTPVRPHRHALAHAIA
jgi:hypothetical protein